MKVEDCGAALKPAARKKLYEGILEWFKANVPVAESELDFDSPFHLLIAVILSAQCTDKRVNMYTPVIFKRFPTPEDLAASDFDEVYGLIKSISFPNNKAKHLLGMARMLVERYGSAVPSDVDELVKLPGVGRKTANVVASIVYDRPVIAVDTHVFRVSRRLGLSDALTVDGVEKDLTENIKPEDRPIAHHWLILHGRYVCKSLKPECSVCGIARWCRSKRDF
ncbi:MAG: endonuclease III [Bacteroidales bacterium]|nr:endonuclease III [Bacteroidales bacterium]